MIVVDTNVMAYLFLPGVWHEEARRALIEDPDWRAPALWRSEFRNVLATYLRGGHIALGEALTLAAWAEDRMEGREYRVDSSSVLRLSAQSGLAAYDCEFVALARDLGAPLLTSDRGLLEAFPDSTVPLSSFAAEPG